MLNKLLKKKSMYEIALDMGISQSTLYSYYTNTKPVSDKMKLRIESYLKSQNKG